jgi:hippurate hydrolase
MIEQKIEALASEFVALRHDLHAHPELQFKEHRTSGIVAERLRSFGYTVETDWAETGVVGIMQRGKSSKTIALRADMDALPIHEQTNLPYASKTAGVMHACGHDGHTATMLAAAKYIAEDGAFDGKVMLVFQPAEEDISGAKRMVDEGLFEKHNVDGIFALHNLPGFEVGQVVVRPGAITACVDIVEVAIIGVGGHGGLPHQACDPVVAAASIVTGLQTIVSRNLDPNDLAVITVGSIHGGVLATVIPSRVDLKIGVRTISAKARELCTARLPALVKDMARAFGCEAEIIYGQGISYPTGYNDAGLAQAVRDVAIASGQTAETIDLPGPFMFSEDFAFFQERVKGCYFGIGNGASANLHDPGYNFNDALIAKGAAFWVKLVERELQG